jgi:molecular chaperone HtpG
VSRELLQSNRVIDKIRAGSVKKVLALIEEMTEKRPDDYAIFWSEFGAVLKEGVVEDPESRETIAGLLRFPSTRDETVPGAVSLADYVARMQPGQEKIYYLTADSVAAATHSPQLEVFLKKDIEVLLLTDRVDEWVMAHLTEFEGKSFQHVAKGALDLGGAESEDDKAAREKRETQAKSLLERLKKALGERVGEVRVTHRLTDSPACLVADEAGLSPHLQRILKDAGQAVPEMRPHLEINPEHPLVKHLGSEKSGERFDEWAQLLFEQAVLAEGGELENPAIFVRRLNRILLALSKRKPASGKGGNGAAA